MGHWSMSTTHAQVLTKEFVTKYVIHVVVINVTANTVINVLAKDKKVLAQVNAPCTETRLLNYKIDKHQLENLLFVFLDSKKNTICFHKHF